MFLKFIILVILLLNLIGAKADVLPIGHGITGAYYDPETSGQGMFVTVTNVSDTDLIIFVSWFTYHPDPSEDRKLLWMVAQSDVINKNQRLHDLKVYLQEGGAFNTSSHLDPSTAVHIGQLTMSFENCNNILLEWDLDYVNSSRNGRGRIVTKGEQSYVRLSSIPRDANNNLLCE